MFNSRRRLIRALLTGGFMAVFLGLPNLALADLTVENLTGSAISGVGPFYQDVQDAIRDFANKEYDKAMAHLESAKKSTPKLPPAEVMMAMLYFDARQAGLGITSLENGVRKAPQDPEPLVMLAELALADGRTTEAGLLVEKANRLVDRFNENPRRKTNLQTRVYTLWATSEEAEGNLQEAQKKLQELVKLEPRNAAARAQLGRVQFRLGQKEKAYAEFQAAAEADPKALPAEVAMAKQFSDKPNIDKWLKFAVQKNGQDLRTRVAIGEFLIRSNQIEEAKTHIEEAIRLDANDLQANTWTGVIARMQGDYQKAEKYLSIAHLMAPANTEIINHLALSLLELPDSASQMRALQFAELNTKQHPNSVELLGSLGWVNYKLGRMSEAQKSFTAVLNSEAVTAAQTASADMAYYLANIAKDRNKISEAVRLLTEALNNNQPFAYRKPAQEMLVQLSKLDKSQGGKTRGASAAKKSESSTTEKTKAESTATGK